MKTFILFTLAFTFSGWLYAQQPVTGRVLTAGDGLPIEGASISLRGTNISVVTNSDGDFTIRSELREGILTIEISHVGFEPALVEVTLPQKNALNIFLRPSSRLLDEVEVVSTGYQKVPKERATGSFSTVSNELFNQQAGTDILSRLPVIANSMVMDNGRQGAPQMMIRGLSTIRGPKDPLIVVDNFPYDGDITNINPNIVENITILKDASAASIWGARAANGVIVITTKSGSVNQPILLSFNTNLTIGAKPDLGYIRQMSSHDFTDVEEELFSRGFYNSQISSSSHPVISPVVDLLNKVRTGEITEGEAGKQIDAFRTVDARDQFNEYMYKPAVNQQYFLSAQGGTDLFSWISSAGYDHDKNNLGATYERINIRFQNTYRPLKQLSLTTGLYYTQTQNKSGRYGYNDVSMRGGGFVPYMQIVDASGVALPVARELSSDYIQTAGEGKLLDWNYYPLTDWQHQTSRSNASDMLATAIIDYQIANGLNAVINYQYERQLGLNTDLADEDSYMARNYINSFAQIVGGDAVFIIPQGGIMDKSDNMLNTHNIRGQMNFNNTFGIHNVTAIAGAEIRSMKSNEHQERFYGYDAINLTTGSVDYTKTYPTLPRGSAFILRNQYLGESITNFVSQFANAAYTFDNRYVLSASVRRDASNLFGLKTNDQWNPFWSAGFAWKLSNEEFYKVNFLPHLNFRATYGLSGNIDPAMVTVNTISYLSQNSLFNGNSMAQFSNYYNPLLKWETSRMLNLAVDFHTKNARVSGSVEYYHKKGENLFGVAPSDYTTGIPPSVVRNVASMKGNGWDIQLRSLNIDQSFTWRTILNFSLYKDKIIEYNIERTLARDYLNQTFPPISGVEGHSVYAIYAYRWAGLAPNTGEPRGYLNGEVSKDYTAITGTGTKVEDLEYFGSAIPTRFGSLINAVSYKNISLQLGISFKFGYFFRRSSINYTNLFNNWRGHSDYTLRWQKPGDEAHTNVPVNPYTTNTNRDAFYNGSSVLVEKGNHVRFQYINLAYNFHVANHMKAGIKELQVYFNAAHLGLLWKANKTGIDPDFNTGTHNIVTPSNYTLGVRTKF